MPVVRPPAVRIRKATQEDTADILSIDPAARTSRRRQLLRDAIATDTCWIALLDHEVTAYAILNYNFFCHGVQPLIYVGYRYRRQGLALKLDVGASQLGREQVPTAEDVERQVAVAVVVSCYN
jgi:hypothetical protein